MSFCFFSFKIKKSFICKVLIKQTANLAFIVTSRITALEKTIYTYKSIVCFIYFLSKDQLLWGNDLINIPSLCH